MDNTLTVALILKPQGVRGEIKVKVLCDEAEDLMSYERVYIDGKENKILNVRPQGDCAFITIKGIADRNAAELLRGKEIIVKREDAPALPENRYYIQDIIGCNLYLDSGKLVGTICEITPAKTDIYVVDNGKAKVPFAAREGVIISIDVDAKKVIVDEKKFNEVALLD
jgi:16S rRNA processing protein RimM